MHLIAVRKNSLATYQSFASSFVDVDDTNTYWLTILSLKKLTIIGEDSSFRYWSLGELNVANLN